MRLMAAMVGIYCASNRVESEAVTLDIDDACDVAVWLRHIIGTWQVALLRIMLGASNR